MSSPIPGWLALLALGAIWMVMISLGLLLDREQIARALRRRVVLAAILFAVIVPVPATAILFCKLFDVRGAIAAGILLMAISPGAPVALRRALQVGGHAGFAPMLHLAIVILAVVTVPTSVAILDWIYAKDFSVSPLHVARQVFIAQLLPLGLGAAFRAWRPAPAERLQPRLERWSNRMLALVAVLLLVNFWRLLVETGWTPLLAGAVLTISALVMGAACAGRDPSARRAGAVAAAMRNPGLALLIAAANQLPVGAVAAIFGYALGLAAVITPFVAWQGRRRPAG
jgi:BASS family bile acid:Na+ symporter